MQQYLVKSVDYSYLKSVLWSILWIGLFHPEKKQTGRVEMFNDPSLVAIRNKAFSISSVPSQLANILNAYAFL